MLGTLEAAQDDLVVEHEEGTEVADWISLTGQLSRDGLGALVEADQIAVVDAGPKALGEVLGRALVFHAS
jgi:hypothetical protein